MDILAARKKAAERLQEQKQPEQEVRPVQPVAEPVPERIVEPPVPVVSVPESAHPAAADAAAQAVTDTAAGETTTEGGSVEAAGEQQLQEVEMLSFRLGGEEYALMVEDVKEVLKNRELTQVPNAPEYVLGVTALRGTGIVVDRVTGVFKIHPEDIRPVPETIVQGSEYLRGIVRKNDRLYILLDREKALGAS
jgi:purine-binding chemotaxis protein CheW